MEKFDFEYRRLSRDLRSLIFLQNVLRMNFLDFLMPIITMLGDGLILMFFLSVLFIFGNLTLKIIAFKTMLTLILSSTSVFLIKKALKRPRPFEIFSPLNFLNLIPKDASFPSGHTNAAFTVFISLALSIPSFFPVAIFISSLVAISRIYLGMHYPTDVAAGAFIGTLFAALIHILMFI